MLPGRGEGAFDQSSKTTKNEQGKYGNRWNVTGWITATQGIAEFSVGCSGLGIV